MGNPLFNMMNPDINSLINNLGKENPQQIMLNMLKNKNPQGYQQVTQLMNSGADPRDILQQMTANMTPQQLQQIDSLAKQFGLK